MRVLLVRHGETALNAEGRFRGRADVPLTARGLQQAGAVAQSLVPLAPATVVSSPRLRARQTAEPIARSMRAAVLVDDRLDDVDYGEWTGLTRAEVVSSWPAQYALWLEAPERLRVPGGERVGGVRDRVWSALCEIAGRGQPAIVVTHDACVRLAIVAFLGAPTASMHVIRVDLASRTELEFGDDTTQLVCANDTSHLRELQ